MDQLEYLINIHETASFSLAAERCHVTQPSISQAINSLEAELGVKIFKRTRQGALPTTEGKIVVKKALEMLSLYNQLREEINIRMTSITGQLKLACVPAICSTILSKTIINYKKKFPLVEVDIIEKGTHEIIHDIQNGYVDVGVVAIQDKKWHNPNLKTENLLTSKIKVCVGKNFPLQNKTELLPKEIVKYPIVMFKSGYVMTTFIHNLLSEHGDVKVLFTLDNTEVAKKVIAEGIGIGFLNSLSLINDPYISNGSISALDIKDSDSSTSYYAIQSKNKFSSQAVDEFIKELKVQAQIFQ